MFWFQPGKAHQKSGNSRTLRFHFLPRQGVSYLLSMEQRSRKECFSLSRCFHALSSPSVSFTIRSNFAAGEGGGNVGTNSKVFSHILVLSFL